MKNFLIRLISSISIVLIVLVALWFGGAALLLLLFLFALKAYHELMRALGLSKSGQRINALELLGLLSITAYYLIMFLADAPVYLFYLLCATLIIYMAVYVLKYPKYHIQQLMEAFFCLVYGPVMLSFIYLARSMSAGFYVALLILISAWICDTCSYCVGMLFGKRRLAPELSPKKTVAGSVGGVIGAALVGALYGIILPGLALDINNDSLLRQPAYVFALICGVGAIIAQIGDLAASAIKRNVGIKDFGALIPGHGGIMDRFDSIIFTAPVIYLLALVFAG